MEIWLCISKFFDALELWHYVVITIITGVGVGLSYRHFIWKRRHDGVYRITQVTPCNPDKSPNTPGAPTILTLSLTHITSNKKLEWSIQKTDIITPGDYVTIEKGILDTD